MTTVPAELRERSLARLTPKGETWFASLPSCLEMAAQEWEVTLEDFATSGVLSACVFGMQGETPVVVKIPSQEKAGKRERRALRRWADTGMFPEVLRENRSRNTVLLERLPGDVWTATGTPEETRQFAELYSRLHATPRSAERMQSVWKSWKWRSSLARASCPQHQQDPTLLQDATEMIRPLMDASRVLTHGDLQNCNILLTPGGLRPIDPMGVAAPAILDLAMWSASLVPSRPLEDIAVDLARLSGTDQELVLRWVWAFAVLHINPDVSLAVGQQAFIDKFRPQFAPPLR